MRHLNSLSFQFHLYNVLAEFDQTEIFIGNKIIPG